MRSSALDDDAIRFMHARTRRTAAEFGRRLPGRPPPLLEWGDRPEFRALTPDGKPRILVARGGADWWRIRYQIAHEVFHWLCTPFGVFHWAHEALAVETALRAMEELGERDYASRARTLLAAEAEQLALPTMLTAPLGGRYPGGLHGRAWVTGRGLVDAAGWDRVKLLAGSFDEHGHPDVAAWIRALPRAERTPVAAVLGSPSLAWV